MKNSIKILGMVMAVLAVLLLASPGYSWTSYRPYYHHHHRFSSPVIVGGYYGYYPYRPYYGYYGPGYGGYYRPYVAAPGVSFFFRF